MPCAAQDVGSKNSTIFIPSNPGHVGDLSAEVTISILCHSPIMYSFFNCPVPLKGEFC